jgi:hypothetical protein
MLWLTWRRHRWLFLIGVLILIGFCTFFIHKGLSIYQVYNQLDLTACHADITDCTKQMNYATLGLTWPFLILHSLILLPLFIGVFIGAPLLPSEQHAAAFIRTQGATLRRWLTIKLGIIILATLFSTVVLALLLDWWTQPLFALNLGLGSKWAYYDSMDGVLIGKALFALLLSIAIGALTRRMLPAMAITFFLMIILIIGGSTIYHQILTPTTYSTSALASTDIIAENTPTDALVIIAGYADQNGQLLTRDQVNVYCGASSNLDYIAQAAMIKQCTKDKHLQWDVIYQPAANYWPTQIIETVALLILSLLLIPAIYWLGRRNLN